MSNEPKDLSPGAALKAERESRGWSIEYISDQINLNKSFVNALEADDYVSLPPPAFVRGYIRSYAKLLEIESNPLVLKYEQTEMPAADVVPLVESDAVTSDPLIRLLSGLAVAVVLGGLAYWWYNNRFAEDEITADTEVTQSESEVADQASDAELSDDALFKSEEADASPDETAAGGSNTPLAPGVSYERPSDLSNKVLDTIPPLDVPISPSLQNNPVLARLSDETVDLDNTPESIEDAVELTELSEAGSTPIETQLEAPETAAEPSNSDEPADTADVASVEGNDILLLKTDSESWVSVTDAKENRLMYGILTSGTPRKLQGLAPFNVVLGAAPGIEVTLNGSNVDFSSLIRRSKTARFVIEPSGDARR